jgi:hypothetical protein
VFANDPRHRRLDFDAKRELVESPKEEGIEEVLRYWP